MASEKRLIDAIALKKAIRAESWKQLRMVQITLDFIDLIIGEQPTVDAVEVVRCKDCKCDGVCSIQDAMNWTPRTEITDAFCSYGERKENG